MFNGVNLESDLEIKGTLQAYTVYRKFDFLNEKERKNL